MKQLKRIGFATALICVTSLLITAFMVLFSYYGSTPNDRTKENTTGNTPADTELKTGKVNFGKTKLADGNTKQFPEKSNDGVEKMVTTK